MDFLGRYFKCVDGSPEMMGGRHGYHIMRRQSGANGDRGVGGTGGGFE